MTETELKALIRSVADFPQPGILFRDITTLIAHPEGLSAAIDGLAVRAQGTGAYAIAGIEARGFIFGAALAIHLGLGFIPLRKAGKLPVATISEDYALEYGTGQLELDPTLINPGQTVLLVDDLIATGGTALAGASLLRRAGATCTHAIFVIELPDLGGSDVLNREGIISSSLVTFRGH